MSLETQSQQMPQYASYTSSKEPNPNLVVTPTSVDQNKQVQPDVSKYRSFAQRNPRDSQESFSTLTAPLTERAYATHLAYLKPEVPTIRDLKIAQSHSVFAFSELLAQGNHDEMTEDVAAARVLQDRLTQIREKHRRNRELLLDTFHGLRQQAQETFNLCGDVQAALIRSNDHEGLKIHTDRVNDFQMRLNPVLAFSSSGQYATLRSTEFQRSQFKWDHRSSSEF